MADLLDKLTDVIRTGKIGQETRRSAKWFSDKIRGLKGDLRNKFSSTNAAKFYREADTKINPNIMKKRISLGDIFCYYYNPKYRAELPYYDMFPMVMLIGTDQDTFTGLNFHYLPPKFRALLLDRVNAKVGRGIINWKKIAKIPQVTPTVKKYRFDHIMRKMIPIEESEQEVAIFLPLERFKKASKSSVWADSKRKFG